MTKQQEVDMAKPALTPREAAIVLDLGMTATYEAIGRGDIPSFRVGNSIRVPTARLKAMLGIAG